MNITLSITDIANWQLCNMPSNVSLPTIQRGFVWKSKQIEDLWDSILRGFPIGSFLFSRTDKSTFDLLDGQQRATAIAAGLYNPYTKENKAMLWSIKGNLPTVWIDINPEELADRNKFLIRVTTRSHPWGYNRLNNTTILSISERKKAFDIFSTNEPNITKYTNFSNKITFPYDSYYPIPLAFFFESENSDSIIEMCNRYLPDTIQTTHHRFKNKKDYISILNNYHKENIEKILKAVKEAKARIYNYDIIDKKVIEQEEESEDPTLFVRINSSGTSLSGDDLIYSIYKSIYPQAKEFIENIAPSFISPTLNLSFALRMVYSKLNQDCYPNKLRVKDFQNQIKDITFKEELSNLIGTEACSKYKTIVNNAIDILQNPTNDIKLPPVLVKQLINKFPDLFLVLLYWLLKNEHKVISNKDKISIAGTITFFHWFALKKNKLPREIWQYSYRPRFWHKPIKKEYFKELICIPIPPDIFLNYLLSTDRSDQLVFQPNAGLAIRKIYESISEEYDIKAMKDHYWSFYKALFFCKPMTLYAQRHYIEEEFGDFNQFEDLEDTNTPWDWDHIYPESWVKRKQNVNQYIKKLINSIGNFRALSLVQNRSESNLFSPAERLKDERMRKISFVKEDWSYWKKIDKPIEDDTINNYTNAVKRRMVNIYSEWWNTLLIRDLQPK